MSNNGQLLRLMPVMVIQLLTIGMIVSLISLTTYTAYASLPSLKVSNPSIFDLTGKNVGQIEMGQQVSIAGSITNDVYLNDDKPMFAIVEVRNQDEMTVYLAWQSMTVSPNNTYTFSTSWTSDHGALGTNTVRTWAVSSLDGAGNEALSGITRSEIIVK